MRLKPFPFPSRSCGWFQYEQAVRAVRERKKLPFYDVEVLLDPHRLHRRPTRPGRLVLPGRRTRPGADGCRSVPGAGNVLTPRQYQTRWLDAYDRTPVDTDPTCTAIDTVVAYARAQLGKPYVFGTAGPDTFDCSGLTLAAYRRAGIDLPHSAAIQATMGSAVPIGPEQVRPGDLVFRRGGDPFKDFGHVGIAISPTEIIHAPHTGDIVRIATIDWNNVQAVRRYALPATR